VAATTTATWYGKEEEEEEDALIIETSNIRSTSTVNHGTFLTLYFSRSSDETGDGRARMRHYQEISKFKQFESMARFKTSNPQAKIVSYDTSCMVV
jgi:hypothetical protein